MRLRLASLLIGASLILGACASAPNGGGSGLTMQSAPAAPADNAGPARLSESVGRSAAPAGNPQSAASKNSGAAPTEASAPRLDRMIVANVNLAITVEDAITAARQAEGVAERYGGFVSSSNVRSAERSREASVTVRVPFSRLSDALAELRGIGQKVTEETRSTQDVTEEFTDTESNIRNLQATEAQLITLMQKASRIEDVMSVQRELTNIRGQIERLEGRRRVLENKADLATIALRLAEPAGQPPRSGWDALEIAQQAIAALAVVAMALGTLFIWLAVFSPLIVVPVALVWWMLRGRVARPTAEQAP